MNRREALGVIGTAAVCPTAAMATTEKKNNLRVVKFDVDGFKDIEFYEELWWCGNKLVKSYSQKRRQHNLNNPQ